MFLNNIVSTHFRMLRKEAHSDMAELMEEPAVDDKEADTDMAELMDAPAAGATSCTTAKHFATQFHVVRARIPSGHWDCGVCSLQGSPPATNQDSVPPDSNANAFCGMCGESRTG